jgi:hypothetical protein
MSLSILEREGSTANLVTVFASFCSPGDPFAFAPLLQEGLRSAVPRSEGVVDFVVTLVRLEDETALMVELEVSEVSEEEEQQEMIDPRGLVGAGSQSGEVSRTDLRRQMPGRSAVPCAEGVVVERVLRLTACSETACCCCSKAATSTN